MIVPALKDEAFLADVRNAQGDSDNFHIWWLGQSGFLVQWKGHHILLDPYLSDSLTKKYADSDKPHVRMTEKVIDPERLDFIEIVTSTHNHTDHLDAETLNPLRRVNPDLKMIIPEANREFVAERLQCDPDWPVGLDDSESVTLGEFTLTGIASAHEQLERDEEGRCKFLGYIVQFGPWTLYHSGDTVVYDGLAQTLESAQIDVALLPINGRAPESRVPGNMFGVEAAQLTKDAGIGLVIPHHFEMFEFNTVSPNEFLQACENLGVNHRVLRNGERWSSGE